MKKLYELDASKEFDDVQSSSASSDDNFSDGIIAGNFEKISGVGVENVSEEADQANVTSIQDMLAKLNTRSDEDMAKALEEEEAARERYRQEEEERLRLAKEKFNRERYEKEQEALRIKKEKEAEEEARRLIEEEEAKKNSLGYKLKSMFSSKKNDKVEEDEQPKKEKPVETKSTKQKEQHYEEISKIAPSFDEVVENPSKCSEEEFEEPSECNEEEVYNPLEYNSEEFAPEPEEILLENSNRTMSFEDELEDGMFELSDKEEEAHEVPSEYNEEEQTKTFSRQKDEKLKNNEFEENTKEESINNEEILSNNEESKKSFFSSLFAGKQKTKTNKTSKTKEKSAKQEEVSIEYEEPDWKYIATHDELTGLLNIRAYTEGLTKMTNKLGVIFFDINNLKYVNDTFTHEAGNKLIKGVSSTIGEYFGTENLYRIGGDEFVILIEKPSKNEEDKVSELCSKIHNKLSDMSKKDVDKIVYAVSIGYAFGDGKATKEEVVKAADIAMYQNKKAYKMSHKELDVRNQKTDVAPPEHDDLLTKEQKMLKGKIQEEHEKASKGSTQQIVREVQKRASEIEAIFIASPSFDHLFVITDIDDFLDIMDRSKQLIDYSYLYIVYSGGPQYYGADEYYKEVTHLFESIADALMSGKFRSEKEIQNIPGINIFKNIYV